MGATWDPQQYARFAGERARPFEDLLARVRPERAPRLVLDVGCGNGPLTLSLARRWPGARIVGLDSSAEMLEQARRLDAEGRVEWVETSAQRWDPGACGAAIDVLVTNATLQWVPGHLDLLARWTARLAERGLLALQVPRNGDAPSHALLRTVAERHPRAADLRVRLDRAGASHPARDYLDLFAGLGLVVDAWETTYEHVLPPGEEHPVLTWMRSTGLRPVLEVLADEREQAAFLADYATALEVAYPRRAYGVPFTFRRAFAVARRA